MEALSNGLLYQLRVVGSLHISLSSREHIVDTYHLSQLRNKKLKDEDISGKVKCMSNWFEDILT